jgi:hypothetical protein
MLTVRTYYLSRHRQKCNCGSTDNNKYKVEEILNAYVNYRKLQYYVK